MTEARVRRDRRHERREQTLAEIVDVAAQIMAEQGVVGLTLGELARRMGIQPPSLYVYFPSKNALYDALFARGWGELLATTRELHRRLDDAADLSGYPLDFATGFVRWAVEHPGYAQLMAWRPVPGYEPSAAAYAPAVETLAEGHAVIAKLAEREVLRRDVDVDRMLRAWTVVTGGVVSQQLANDPQSSFEDGAFTSELPALVEMFMAQYGHHAERSPAV